MSDTPRTDANSVRFSTLCAGTDQWWVPRETARQLERELADAQHRIRTLIEERDSARIQADHKWKLREEFEALLGTDNVAAGVANVQHMKRNADRYEVVRKMNAIKFAELLQRCLFQDLRFDDEVDRLAAIKMVKMHLKVKEDAR